MNKAVRRLAAAGTAAVAVGIGSAVWASASASADSAASIPKCTTADLAVWVSVDEGSGAAGSVYYPLEFTNISGHTCYLYAYPGVSAVSSSGKQLGSAASRDAVVKPEVVNVAAGGTAHATLRYIDAEVATAPGCKPADAAYLKVYPEAQTTARTALFDLPSCSAAGHVYLTITAVQPGT